MAAGSPYDLRMPSPDQLLPQPPKDKDLVRYSELRYARFCWEFERAATTEILRHDPREVVVVSQ